MKNIARLLAVTALLLPAVAGAQAQFPVKPVRLLVSAPPGGAVDLIARVLSQNLAATWGQPVVVENKTGAGGLLAAQTLAQSPGDGYTLCMMGDGLITMRPFLQEKMPYDTLTDIVPVAIVARIAYVLVASPSLKVRTVQDLIGAAKARPKEINYASSGIGGTHHVGMELFQHLAGVQLYHIPYKGATPALQDVMAGRVSVMWSAVSSALPFVKEGKLAALAVGELERSSLMPDVPTVAETIPKFEFSTWMGVMASKGIPPPVLDKISTDLQAIARTPAYRDALLARGAEPSTSSQKVFAERMRAEYDRNRVLFKTVGIKGD
jgi:tripartite-type tricarboxylate transporter receptor subunit TctC